MTGDRLTLDLGQYFKITFFCACAIISQSWLLSIRTNALYTDLRSWQRDLRAVAISPVRFFCRLLGPFIHNLSCVYSTLPLVRHET